MKISQIAEIEKDERYTRLVILELERYAYTVYHEGRISLNLWTKVRKIKWESIK